MTSPRSLFPYPPPEIRHGIGCYHPGPAQADADYPEDAFEKLIQVEDGYFWFEARNDVLRYLIETWPGQSGHRRFLEIGCGTGKVLSLLASLPGFTVAGAEVHASAAALAAARVPGVEVVQLDVLKMDFSAAFDAIGVFDVLEHLDDEAALIRIRDALTPGGICFITVPQHPWLWSTQDDLSGHKRRYTLDQLTSVLRRSGFELVFVSSFFCAVLPILIASRWLKQLRRRRSRRDAFAESLSEMILPKWLNRLLRGLTAIDLALVKRGIRLPCGGSLLAVAERRS